jgi:hypothetical protein
MRRTQTALAAIFAMAVVPLAFLGTPCRGAEPNDEKWQVYSFPKPTGFDSLATFVQENYGDALDQNTVSAVALDGRTGVSFWTVGQNSRQFNLVFEESDTTLVLMTSARLKSVGDLSEETLASTPATASNLGALKPASTVMPPPFSTPCFTSANACNCVLYAKCLAPWLNPNQMDLTTFFAKKRLINSQVPSIGAVAVIQVFSGNYVANGHMAVVIAVNHNSAGHVTTVEITEAHWGGCGFDVRIDTPANLHIVGYIVR